MPISTIRFSSANLQKAFLGLEKGTTIELELFIAINTSLNKLEENCFCGVQIPKKQIPKEYKEYHNLWKINLPRGWRLIYSIIGEERVIISIVLDWFDHKSYERKMRYN